MVSNIVWLTQPTQKSLLTCNAREVKLWSVKEHQQYQVTSSKRNYKSKNKLIIPKSKPNGEAIPESKLKHTFKSGLETNLHSLSLTSDHQQFLSSDDKSINLWDLNAYDSPVYNFINLNGQGAKRKEQPQYLISSASFNQFSQSSLFMYTTSNGNIHICDVRERSDF